MDPQENVKQIIKGKKATPYDPCQLHRIHFVLCHQTNAATIHVVTQAHKRSRAREVTRGKAILNALRARHAGMWDEVQGFRTHYNYNQLTPGSLSTHGSDASTSAH